MKKSIIAGLALGTVILVAAGALSAMKPQLVEHEVDALSSCEVTNKNGEVVVSCSGDTGTCSIHKYGHTLTCSGEKD